MNVNALKSIIINLKLKHKKVIEIYAKNHCLAMQAH